MYVERVGLRTRVTIRGRILSGNSRTSFVVRKDLSFPESLRQGFNIQRALKLP